MKDSYRYFNRELSLLEFQRRVLEEAEDEANPLLERVKFLAIFGSNMDEFFMVRVSGIRKLVEANVFETSIDGRLPREELVAIRKKVIELFGQAQKLYQRKLLPQLNKAGIHILTYKQLSVAQKRRADTYFLESVYPILTPLAIDPGHPFPHISNLSLNLGIVIRDAKGKEKFSRLKVPDTLPRLVPIKSSPGDVRKDVYFVWLEQVIVANIGLLFPGMEIVSADPFRIVRDADIEIQEIEADDLLEAMQQSIRKRKFGSVVEMAHHATMPADILNVLVENLEINATDVYTLSSLLGLSSLWQLYNSVERSDLKFPYYKQVLPKAFQRSLEPEDFFSIIRKQNILLHHPYDSFKPVVDFLTAAARDPNVLAIKQTLYRVGKDSPVVDALLEAAERGKQVAVLVELKARFDEESNIEWARKLEQMGMHVVYGLVGLKTHCKVTLVVRREGEGIRRYVHYATGNYNSATAQLYEDIGIFTCDEGIVDDVTDLFNYLTGYSLMDKYKKILVAPLDLRSKLEAFIHREMEHARNGEEAHLIFKVNSVEDKGMIDLLYEASQAGVKIDLLTRGVCCLRPGVKGLSENIHVSSVVGRYLEHSRIFYFRNGGCEEIYIGSADLMTRNLIRRVETLIPVEDPQHILYLRDGVLNNYFKDNLSTRILQPNGNYQRIEPKLEDKPVNIQKLLMARA